MSARCLGAVVALSLLVSHLARAQSSQASCAIRVDADGSGLHAAHELRDGLTRELQRRDIAIASPDALAALTVSIRMSDRSTGANAFATCAEVAVRPWYAQRAESFGRPVCGPAASAPDERTAHERAERKWTAAQSTRWVDTMATQLSGADARAYFERSLFISTSPSGGRIELVQPQAEQPFWSHGVLRCLGAQTPVDVRACAGDALDNRLCITAACPGNECVVLTPRRAAFCNGAKKLLSLEPELIPLRLQTAQDDPPVDAPDCDPTVIIPAGTTAATMALKPVHAKLKYPPDLSPQDLSTGASKWSATVIADDARSSVELQVKVVWLPSAGTYETTIARPVLDPPWYERPVDEAWSWLVEHIAAAIGGGFLLFLAGFFKPIRRWLKRWSET